MQIKVWDLPTRLFHWLLVICVCGAFITIKIGGNAVEYHFWFGYATLTLLLFRLLWGICGGYYSRFMHFSWRPKWILAYLRGQHATLPLQNKLGHNPLGSLSVLAILVVLLFQAVSGLFANDDIASAGPLAIWLSKELSDRITAWHKANQILILSLLGLHLAAIIFYRIFKREALLQAMFTGTKELDCAQSPPSTRDGWAQRLFALVLFSLIVALVYTVLQLKPFIPTPFQN